MKLVNEWMWTIHDALHPDETDKQRLGLIGVFEVIAWTPVAAVAGVIAWLYVIAWLPFETFTVNLFVWVRDRVKGVFDASDTG